MKNITNANREICSNMDFQNTNTKAISFHELIKECNTSSKKEIIKTGIDFLDSNTCFYKGNISLLAGRADSKKEDLLMDIALNMAIESKHVAYISFNKNLDSESLKTSFKEKCLKKSQDTNILKNIHILIIEKANILNITKELAKLETICNIKAIFIDDDKPMFFGEDIKSFRNNFSLKEYLSWELSQLAIAFNIHIFMACRVSSKCQNSNYIDDITDIKCSMNLVRLSKFIIGLTCINRDNYVNINILKNAYGNVNVSSKITIN